MALSSGVHARLTVDADCALASALTRHSVLRFTPGDPPQVILNDPDDGAFEGAFDPIVRDGETVVCRVDTAELNSDERARHLATGFSRLPAEPYNLRWQGDHLRVCIAARDDDELQATVRRLETVGFDVRLRQLTTADADIEGDTAVVDLSALTERQRRLAERAADAGYFDPDGATAEGVATELDINKATLSEHLRSVQRELIQQTFGS